MNNESTASILDKTDWRKTIHKCLEKCVNAQGTTNYPNAVEGLVSAVSGKFPNWDAGNQINKFLIKLNKEYKQKISELIEKNPDYWIHPGKRVLVEPDLINAYYMDIFHHIFDTLGLKRMLLWGDLDSRAVSYDEVRRKFNRTETAR